MHRMHRRRCSDDGWQAVTHAEGAALALEFSNMPFFETSAKQNENIEEMFRCIVTAVKGQLEADSRSGGGLGTDHGHKLGPVRGGTTNKKSGCC